MEIGERIKLLRKKAGLTQKELGELLNVSAAMIAQYENNLRNPKFETLDKIANALNVDVWDLYDEPPPVNKQMDIKWYLCIVYALALTGREERLVKCSINTFS